MKRLLRTKSKSNIREEDTREKAMQSDSGVEWSLSRYESWCRRLPTCCYLSPRRKRHGWPTFTNIGRGWALWRIFRKQYHGLIGGQKGRPIPNDVRGQSIGTRSGAHASISIRHIAYLALSTRG